MTICYLEVEDEITVAVARLRVLADREAVLVLPHGSRIATSRINFKLLAREATDRRLNLVAVSDEPSVRALAISAGVPAYDSIASAEGALHEFRAQDARLAERTGRPPTEQTPRPVVPVPTAGAPREPTVRSRRPPGGDAPAGPHQMATAASAADAPRVPQAGTTAALDSAERSAARRRARPRLAPVLVVAVLALIVAGVAYAGYMFLPTVSITLRPAATTAGPITADVTADPDVAVPDIAAGLIPAQSIEVPLSVSGDFEASGLEVTEMRATGTVRFRSENTLSGVPVPEGTEVSTADGVEFVTTAREVVPRADFATSTPGVVDVPIRSVRAGTRGNVAADTITQLPQELAQNLVSVRNREPTSGGRRIEQIVVTGADYDAALETLGEQLVAAMQTALVDPANIPRGLTAYPQTAQLSEGQPEPPASAVVDAAAESFSLTLDGSARVLAVDESLIDLLAVARLRSGLAAGEQIVGDQVTATHSAGEPAGQTVHYEVTASARAYRPPDRDEVLAAVRGKTVDEARAILERYGAVEIDIWPDFVDRMPDQLARVNLSILPPQENP